MPKKQLLPPASDAHRREVSVNLRFSVEDYARLKKVAEFSETTVANLLFYVTMNTTLPLMEQEVQRAIKVESKPAEAIAPDQINATAEKLLIVPDQHQGAP